MKRILVVDDEQNSIESVKNRLEANNYDVIFASDGEQGVKKAKEHRPDLILMDVLMPNMSGGEAVRALKADERTKHIPVIFLTVIKSNIPQEEDKGINVDEQFYPVISKPVKLDKLLFEIRRIIGG